MATKHILSLEIPTVSNCGLLCIKDTSQYSTELAVDCAELLITLPGFKSTALVKVEKDFDICLSACGLLIQTENCGTTQTNIPDGVYVIKYSVSPNDKVFVEYNHLRVTQLMTSYYKVLCDLDVQPKIPDSEKAALLREMDFIRTLYLIYLHADESHTKNKIQIKSDYIKIIKDLNYPYINIHFFNNYFK